MGSPLIPRCANAVASKITPKSPAVLVSLFSPSDGASLTLSAAQSGVKTPVGKSLSVGACSLHVRPSCSVTPSFLTKDELPLSDYLASTAKGAYCFSPGNCLLQHYTQPPMPEITLQSPRRNAYKTLGSPVIALEFSASKECNALIHSPCRTELFKKERSQLYHQQWNYDEASDDTKSSRASGSFKNRKMPRLGSGSYGSVYSGRYDSKRVAIKQFYSRTDKINDQSFCAELNAFRLDHPNIVRIVTFTSCASFLQVVFEFAGPRNLQQLLDDAEEAIDFQRRHKFNSQIASALEYCHRNRIVHLDIKPSNVIVTETDNCKVGDFGCSKRLPLDCDYIPVSGANSTVGTLIYNAPELLRGHRATAKADVYSFGIVVWQCISRKIPFEGLDVHPVVFCVVAKGLRPDTDDELLLMKLSSGDEQLLSLARMCWNSDLALRLDMITVCKRLQELATQN